MLSESLDSMPDFDPRIVESCRGVVLPLPPRQIEKKSLVIVRRTVFGTHHSLARAISAVVCACTTCWNRFDVVGGFPYDFTTKILNVIPPHRTKQRKICPCSVSHGRIGPVQLEKEDRMQAATETVRRKTALPAAEERRQ